MNDILFSVMIGTFVLGYIKAGIVGLFEWNYLPVRPNGESFFPGAGSDDLDTAKKCFLNGLPAEVHPFVKFEPYAG